VDPTPETSDLEAAEASLGEAGSFLADISTSIPGIDEAMSFAEVMRQVQSMDYSAIVFDTAPTGHTLRLLQFPTTLEKGLGKLAALRESFGGMISQVSRMFAAPGAEDVVETMMNKLDALKVGEGRRGVNRGL
jgi:arsenite-transporting ATPase